MGQPGVDSDQGIESNGVVPHLNGGASPAKQQLEGKEALRYANVLRSRNKFADAIQLYNVVLEKEGTNVEALIGKGICLQAQSLPREAIECFTEAVKIEPENACALTHCGMIYKDEGHLVEAAEVFLVLVMRVPLAYLHVAEKMLLVCNMLLSWTLDALYGTSYGVLCDFNGK